MRLILASASPRRAQVLKDAGIPFESVAADVDESRKQNETPEKLVGRLAEAKARAVAERLDPARGPAIVVGADTEVVADGEILGKPASAEDARRMLRRLSGQTHHVITGLALLALPSGELRLSRETTRVTFAHLGEPEIESYIASGEPFDKAGAYAIQGRGGCFITRIEGCYFNVVGLPLAKLYQVLSSLGWDRW
jgi:septum formation protein